MENKRLVKVYIVDDDVNAAKLLIMQLKNYSVEIVGQAQDATEETKNEIVELEPDMVFLDVEMPSMSGLSFWSTIQPAVKPNMKVVFYTGYDKYMLEALRRQAFDFLLKPASQPELAQVMMRYYENKLSNIQAALPQSDDYQPSVMVVNALNEHTVLRFDDIAFFRFDCVRRIWEIITINNTTHQLRHRTTADTILAYSKKFVQIHKAYIVNVHQISKVLDNQCLLRPPLDDIKELRISKNYRHDFMAAFYSM